MKSVVLVGFLFFALSYESFAQKIFFRNYTVTDGLCANTIWDIAQDDQGFMWFGTKYGLNRFDGHEFKSYQFNKNEKNSIGNNFIRKIFKYNAQTFWIGTENGIYIFDLETERFKLFNQIGKKFINDIFKDSHGNIWVATKDSGAYKYNVKTEKIVNYRHSSDPSGLSSNEISKIIEDEEGNIWIGTYGKGVNVLSPQGIKIRSYQKNNRIGSLSNDFILSMLKDLDGNIWVGTFSGGLNLWNKKTNDFTVYQKGAVGTISDNIVRDIYQEKAGILYLATEKGFNVFDVKANHFKNYQHTNTDLNSMSDNAVYTVFKDREGGFWIGTYFGGLNYYNENSNNLEYYYSSGDKSTLVGNAVSAFLQTSNNEMWVGTEDGGLNLFDMQGKTFKNYPFEKDQQPLSYRNIHALYEDENRNIWIGMYTGGLNILNPKTGKIKRYLSNPADPKSLTDNSVYSIDKDRQGRIWVSTISGLNLYNPKEDNFTRIKNRFLEKSCSYQVYQDRNLNLWIATYDNGLIKIDTKGNTKQFAVNNQPNSITSNKVISILDDDMGNLWLGTDGGGLNVLDMKTETFRDFGVRFSLESDVIYGVLKQSKNKFWLSSNKGLYLLDLKSNQKINFNKWDNLQSQQYNYKAFYKDTNGKMYFGGINGFNAFNPETIKSPSNMAPIIFTNFQIFNKDLTDGEPDNPLTKAVNFTKEIVLHHNQSVISIEYAQLSFAAPNKVQYAFKMDGFDKDWNQVGSQRKATYTNLPAGRYKFMVTELNNAVDPYKKPYTLSIVILPPFYQTKLAYLLYILVAGLIVYLLIKFFANKNRIRNEIKLERLKNKSEKEFYKQKIEFFTVMAHEIRTPLSLIVAPLERLISKKQIDSDNLYQLQIMEENCDRLLTLVNQLLDFRRIESDIYTIHLEKVELISFIKSIKDKFSGMTYQKGIDFSMISELKNLEVMIDPEALNKIISNLLINASKFARKKVVIYVKETSDSKYGKKMIAVAIEDDGIGIPKDQIDSIFTKFFKVKNDEHYYNNLGGSGIGLALAKSLVQKHNGALLVESEQNVKTTFTVLIPLLEKALNTNPHVSVEEQLLVEPTDGQPTILVVEDDGSLLDFISENYKSDGYFVLKAENGTEAMRVLDKHHIDIVVTDVMMEQMDGIELCKLIKNDMAYSHIPVVLLTAKTDSDAVTEGLESGADAYVAKPFKWKNLALITKNLIDLRLTLKQRFSQYPFESIDVLPSGAKDKDFLNKLIGLIEDRISDPQLSVEELCKVVGLSRSSLYKKVKSMTGYVPNEFIRLIRLKNAAKLLSTKNYNISEIGYMVGFSSHSYFSKCFFQQFKLTPTEFAEQHKQD